MDTPDDAQDRIGRRFTLLAVTTALAATAIAESVEAQLQTSVAPLASWNDGPAKQAILDFVRATTDPANRHFVAQEDRIATFDPAGTVWVEHPLYSQAMFARDRMNALASQPPEWKSQEPFQSVLANDVAAVTQ